MRRTEPDKVKDILSLLKIGVPKTVVAKKHGMDRRTVWKITKEAPKYLGLDKLP